MDETARTRRGEGAYVGQSSVITPRARNYKGRNTRRTTVLKLDTIQSFRPSFGWRTESQGEERDEGKLVEHLWKFTLRLFISS